MRYTVGNCCTITLQRVLDLSHFGKVFTLYNKEKRQFILEYRILKRPM